MTAPPHNDVVDAYLAAIPDGETQEVTARRVGLKRPRMTKIILARESGDDVRLHPKTAKRFERETKGLLDGDPIHRARLDGMRQAAEMFEEALDSVWAIVGNDPRSVRSPSDRASAVKRAREVAQKKARVARGKSADAGGRDSPPGEKAVG